MTDGESRIERLAALISLDADQLDRLPFGAIVVDRVGTILAYSDGEERVSRRHRADVLGKGFFSEIAPCTANPLFQGRFEQFFDSLNVRVSDAFVFVFPFPFGAAHVSISFVRLDGERVLIAVERADVPA